MWPNLTVNSILNNNTGISRPIAIVFEFLFFQVARGELRNSNSLEQLKQDWEAVDLKSAYAQALYAAQPMKIPQEYSNLLPQCEWIQQLGVKTP